MFRRSEAGDIAELLAAGFARASRPTKVVLASEDERPIRTKMRVTMTILTTMMTQL